MRNQPVELPDEGFSDDPALLFDQACRVERVGWRDKYGDAYFLIFERVAEVLAPEWFVADPRGIRLGSHIAAYPCDEHGVVACWDWRYELESHDYNVALAKLRFQVANDVAIACACSPLDLPGKELL